MFGQRRARWLLVLVVVEKWLVLSENERGRLLKEVMPRGRSSGGGREERKKMKNRENEKEREKKGEGERRKW